MELQFLQVRDASNERIGNPQEVAELMSEEAKVDREALWVLHLNTYQHLILKELVSLGTINHTSVHPREVFKRAILNSSFAIITVHNHPSGSTNPSKKDKEIWSRLIKAGKILGIDVVDNLIITPEGRYYSQTQEGGGEDNQKT